MPKQKPFRVEVVVDTSRDVVWKALTEPKAIRQWFGWEHPSFADEVDFIFVDGATRRRPDAIELLGGQTLELEADGARTRVRAVYAGTTATAEWREAFDAAEEGWRTNLHQLRYYLEQRAGQTRRTVHLEGDARAADVLAELGTGSLYHESRYQRAVLADTVNDGASGDLIGIVAAGGTQADAPGRVAVTVSAYGRSAAAFASLRGAWTERWAAIAPNGSTTP